MRLLNLIAGLGVLCFANFGIAAELTCKDVPPPRVHANYCVTDQDCFGLGGFCMNGQCVPGALALPPALGQNVRVKCLIR